MSDWPWGIAAVAFVIGSWSYMNHWYRRIFGAPLRWRFLWAAHGSVLFLRRCPSRWERPQSRSVGLPQGRGR